MRPEGEPIVVHRLEGVLLGLGGDASILLSLPLRVDALGYLRSRVVAALDGQGKLRSARFDDGGWLPIEGIFIALGVAGTLLLFYGLRVIIDRLARRGGAGTAVLLHRGRQLLWPRPFCHSPHR